MSESSSANTIMINHKFNKGFYWNLSITIALSLADAIAVITYHYLLIFVYETLTGEC